MPRKTKPPAKSKNNASTMQFMFSEGPGAPTHVGPPIGGSPMPGGPMAGPPMGGPPMAVPPMAGPPMIIPPMANASMMEFNPMMEQQIKGLGPQLLSGPQLQQYHAQLLVYRQMTENKPVSQNLLFMSDGHMPLGVRPGFNVPVESTVMNPEPTNPKVQNALKTLSQEAKELYLLSEVPILDEVPKALPFYRNWIASNKPVIISGAAKNWPAINKWTDEYLRSHVGDHEVTVAVTPNGYADAPNDGKFVMPEERLMKFSEFLDIINDPSQHNGVFYVQKQNSNLTDEFSAIIGDVGEEVPWFSEALGKQPDAVNFWMGDERAVTSMHKDNYENIYCVIRGHKDFILHPPTDAPWIPYKKYKPALYKLDSDTDQFNIEEVKESDEIPWIAIDPLNPDLEKYPQYSNSTPIRCRVKAGDALYLPSLWYHHVRQSHGCIAVNYWYDMEYDIKYNYYQLLQNLTWEDNEQ